MKDYLRIIVKVPQEKGDEAALIEAFRAFDTSGIGVVSVDQLRHAMLNLGEGKYHAFQFRKFPVSEY